MKYLIIADDIGNPIYFDHPKGRMICLPMATSQDLLDEGFGEMFESIHVSTVKLVFHQCGYMRMLAVSDHGESEDYLSWQLHLVQHLLMLRYGPRVIEDKRHTNFLKQQRHLQSLFDTTHHLSLSRQYWVDRTVKESNLSSVTNVLIFVGATKLLLSHSLMERAPDLIAADLLLLSILARAHFKPSYREVHREKLPVANYRNHSPAPREQRADMAPAAAAPMKAGEPSHAPPHGSEGMLQAALAANVAGQSMSPVAASSSPGARTGTDNPSTEDDEFLSAEEWEADTADVDAELQAPPASTSRPVPMKKQLRTFMSLALNDYSRGPYTDALQPEESFSTPVADMPHGPDGGTTDTDDAHYESARGPEYDSFGEDAPMVGLGEDEEADDGEEDEEEDGEEKRVAAEAAHGDRQKPVVTAAVEASAALNVPSVVPPSSVDASAPLRSAEPPAGVRERAPEKPKPAQPVVNTEPLHQDIYLRVGGNYQKSCAHFYQLESSITLILIAKPQPADKEERDAERKKMRRIHRELGRELRGYFPFLVNQHRTHLVPNITKYEKRLYTLREGRFVHKLPGLVHFIFVERTSERVIAPTITALQGKEFAGSVEQRKSKTHMLKKKVWATVFCGQAALSNGYTCMLMTAGDFQYSYRLWFVDDGQEVAIPDVPLQKAQEQPAKLVQGTRLQLIDLQGSQRQLHIHTNFYKELTKRLFPGRNRVRCFELYTLYVAGVSATTVNNHNAALVTSLLH